MFTFQVDNVTPKDAKVKLAKSPVYDEKCDGTYFEMMKLRLEKKKRSYEKDKMEIKPEYEASSHEDVNDTFYRAASHGFASAAISAYDLHLPLCVDVEAVKLTIVQQFGIHVNQNAETLRDKLVNHEGKKEIIVRRDDFVRGSKNPWLEVFSEFSDAVKAQISDPELVMRIRLPNTTTTVVTQAAMEIALLDVVQKYFDYTLMTLCGIPSVTLLGTVDDWKNLKSLVSYLGQFDFEWYTNNLLPILDEFIAAAEGNPRTDFWAGMVRTADKGSGCPRYYGWIKYLFAYDGDNKFNHNEKSYIETQNLSSGISSVPFKWNYLGQEFSMKFLSGFFALGVNNRGEVYPEIGWVIQNLTTGAANVALPINFINCAKYGEKRESAMGRYKPDYGVNCDMCESKLREESCISYSANSDLCMKCFDEIKMMLGYREQYPPIGQVECDLCKTSVNIVDSIVCDSHIDISRSGIDDNFSFSKFKVKNVCSPCFVTIDNFRKLCLSNCSYYRVEFTPLVNNSSDMTEGECDMCKKVGSDNMICDTKIWNNKFQMKNICSSCVNETNNFRTLCLSHSPKFTIDLQHS